MFMTKIKRVLTVVLVVGLALGGIGAGFGPLTNPTAAAQTEPPKQPPPKEESPTSPVAAKTDEKPPHIAERTDMKGRMESGLPSQAAEDGAVVVKTFFAKTPTYPWEVCKTGRHLQALTCGRRIDAQESGLRGVRWFDPMTPPMAWPCMYFVLTRIDRAS